MSHTKHWRIPTDRQAEALRLHYGGMSVRRTYETMYPRGASDRPTVGAFQLALEALAERTEDAVRGLAEREGVPYFRADEEVTGDRAEELLLSGEVRERPLPPEDLQALADLDEARGLFLREMRLISRAPFLPSAETGAAESRAKALACLGNAVTANVSARVRALVARVGRTVALHNARLSGEVPGAVREPAEDAPAFVLDMPQPVRH